MATPLLSRKFKINSGDSYYCWSSPTEELSICTRELRRLTDISKQAKQICVEIYPEEMLESITLVLCRDDHVVWGKKVRGADIDNDFDNEITLDYDTENFILNEPLFKGYNKIYAVVYEYIIC